MATMTITLPDPIMQWIEAQVRQGAYPSASDHFFHSLARRDKARHEHAELTLDELRDIVADASASGVSKKSVADIFAEAKAGAVGARGG